MPSPLDYEGPRENNTHDPPTSLRGIAISIAVILLAFFAWCWFAVARERAADRVYQRWQLSTQQSPVTKPR
jgi:hypothetical protein